MVCRPIKFQSSFRSATIPDLLTAQAERDARACAMQTPSGEELSYGALHQRVNNISASSRVGSWPTFTGPSCYRTDWICPSCRLPSVHIDRRTVESGLPRSKFQSYLNDIHADRVIALADDRHPPVRVVARKNDIPVVELASDGVNSYPAFGHYEYVRPGKNPFKRMMHSRRTQTTSPHTAYFRIDLPVKESASDPSQPVRICSTYASLNLDERDSCLSMWEQFHIGGLVDLLLVRLQAAGELF